MRWGGDVLTSYPCALRSRVAALRRAAPRPWLPSDEEPPGHGAARRSAVSWAGTWGEKVNGGVVTRGTIYFLCFGVWW